MKRTAYLFLTMFIWGSASAAADHGTGSATRAMENSKLQYVGLNGKVEEKAGVFSLRTPLGNVYEIVADSVTRERIKLIHKLGDIQLEATGRLSGGKFRILSIDNAGPAFDEFILVVKDAALKEVAEWMKKQPAKFKDVQVLGEVGQIRATSEYSMRSLQARLKRQFGSKVESIERSLPVFDANTDENM